MFGNGFYNPYTYQPYYQTASMARNFGGLANAGNLSRAGSGLINGRQIGNGLANGLGKGLLGKFSFTGFLNGASKTLNVVNQAIPIFYQVRPIINNAKTMFKIMGAVRDDGNSRNNRVQEVKKSNFSSTSANDSNQNSVANIRTPDSNELETDNPIFFI